MRARDHGLRLGLGGWVGSEEEEERVRMATSGKRQGLPPVLMPAVASSQCRAGAKWAELWRNLRAKATELGLLVVQSINVFTLFGLHFLLTFE